MHAPLLSPNRIHTLDSLRGLASLQVLFHHCFLVSILFYHAYSGPIESTQLNSLIQLFTFSPAHLIWAGQEAVTFFFILSGFVLSLPYYRNKAGSYKSFLVNRIFRIYLPYLVTLGIGFLLNYIYNQHPRMDNLSPWLNDFYRSPVTGNEMISMMFRMTGHFDNVVTSLWSLPIELKISLIFPFVAFLLKRANILFSFLLLALNLLIIHGGTRLGLDKLILEYNLFYYLTFFLIGAIISKYHHHIQSYIENLKMSTGILLIILAVILYTVRWNIQQLPDKYLNIATKMPRDYVVSIASVIIILLGTSGKFGSWLKNKYLARLGEISFSLYLVHPLVIGVIAFQFGQILPPYLIVISAFFLSLLLAFPYYNVVEFPLQKLGKSLSKDL